MGSGTFGGIYFGQYAMDTTAVEEAADFGSSGGFMVQGTRWLPVVGTQWPEIHGTRWLPVT